MRNVNHLYKKSVAPNSLFQKFDTSKTILEAFSKEYSSAFVALNPFNKKVFTDKYDPIDRLELTFPLWETVSWKQVAAEMGFRNIQVLASAMTDHKSSLYRELKDYLDEKDLEWPVINEEVIPVETIIGVLKNTTGTGSKEVVKSYTQDIFSEDERTELKFEVPATGMFEAAKSLHYSSLILIPEVGIAILRPMKDDCPYTLILSQSENPIGKEFNPEGFEAGAWTKFYWWK
ncbi:hypothetical protein [Flavihumibacter solisilvae]|uniref:Uncharacterized protein n=1 Tax=Flavihumibacter solisilvae TaxID=1349421 RepID=A0A0C1LI44_9BACT|nr:hypothetical protein [Flavihumibacter solisilvae]KIC95023.1 hypothetical protein OI18_09075 [Flavihumibacter solisilvae]